LFYQLEFYISKQTAYRASNPSEVISITKITDVQLTKNQKCSIELMCGATCYNVGLNCENAAERLMNDLQYLVTEYHKLHHHVVTYSRRSSIGKLLDVDGKDYVLHTLMPVTIGIGTHGTLTCYVTIVTLNKHCW